ncbi:hypothetical protein [Halobacillus salinus]|uniref:Uncharacterized protein n=1 Tax=Halobacillus salinus TaxID=192814 RepID=A0A4Z0GVJ2_9BACI|nr:hypothetical protein [Halobacillus salinus]TGB01712.1 hypothetical protein E4663_16285 [Halobacillus salinus]
MNKLTLSYIQLGIIAYVALLHLIILLLSIRHFRQVKKLHENVNNFKNEIQQESYDEFVFKQNRNHETLVQSLKRDWSESADELKEVLEGVLEETSIPQNHLDEDSIEVKKEQWLRLIKSKKLQWQDKWDAVLSALHKYPNHRPFIEVFREISEENSIDQRKLDQSKQVAERYFETCQAEDFHDAKQFYEEVHTEKIEEEPSAPPQEEKWIKQMEYIITKMKEKNVVNPALLSQLKKLNVQIQVDELQNHPGLMLRYQTAMKEVKRLNDLSRATKEPVLR